MYPSQQQHPVNDPASSGRPLWRPNIPHHFPQIDNINEPVAPGSSQGSLPLESCDGLNNLASAATVSDPYNVPQAGTPSQGLPNQEGPPAFIANEDFGPGASSIISRQREQMRAKRRVPSSLRKRTQVSCDACKTRRCKCVRLKETLESGIDAVRHGAQPPCKLCIETGVPCVTTMPRKQRVYGSVENLDKRYRALEALVSGLFPDLNPRASAEELVTFGREKEIAMPDLGEAFRQPRHPSAGPSIKPEPTESSQQATSNVGRRWNSNLVIAGTGEYKTILPPSYLMRGISTATPHPSPESTTDGALDHNGECTGLILDASGRPHYIGPCGSLAFFASMRDLFSQRFDTPSRSSNGTVYARRGFTRDKAAFYANNPLAASLGGTGDRGRACGYSPVRGGAQASPNGDLDHLDGDAPPRICVDMLKDYPNDPEFWRYRKRVSMLELPSREQADACVEAFFRHVHPNFVLFHRLTFQSAYEKMWRCWKAYRGGRIDENIKEVSVSVGWLCCLFMVFILGSRSLPQSADSLTFQRKWFANVDGLPQLLGTSSLPNVCAYMLLALYYHNTNDRTSAWSMHGAGCRLAIALGMHRESASDLFDPLERQLRKLVWWTLYSFEQFLCCSLGRPSAIDDREMDVGIPNDDYLDANLLPPRYIEHSAQLDMLLAAVRRGIFDPSFVPGRMCGRALEFLDTFGAWKDTLPRRLTPAAFESGFDDNANQWRCATLLQVRYHYGLSFLTSPFLLETIQSGHGSEPPGPDMSKIKALSRVCLTAAMRCGDYIINLWRAGCINGVAWIDIFFVYMSSLDIALVLSSPDLLDQGSECPEIRKPGLIQEHTAEEMKEVIRQLCEVMSTIEMCGTSARFAKAAFEFASALGIVPQEKSQSLRMHVPDEKTTIEGKDINDEDRPEATGQDQESAGNQMQGTEGARELNQEIAAMPSYFYPPSYMNLDFQEGGLSNIPSTAMGTDLQWDMILPPSLWNDGALNMDLDWVWQCPNQSWHGNHNGVQ